MAAPPLSEISSKDASLSLYQLLDPEVLANPYPLFHRLQDADPVHWDAFLHAWVATRYEDVLQVLHSFSAERTPTPEQLDAMGLSQLNPIARVMVKQMLFMDAPAHTRLRGLASRAFTPGRVELLGSHIREIVNRLLDKVTRAGQMDVIRDLAEPLPAIVTAEMLGVPISDFSQLKIWSADFAEMLGNFQHNPDHAPRMLATVEEMTAYFRNTISELRCHPRDGLMNAFLTAEIDGDRLTDEEVIANTIVTMVGGQETTTNLIGNGLLTLLRHPEEMTRLRDDLSLVPSAVEEMLRYESPSQHTARLAPSDCELGGKTIRKRDAVIAVMAAANRDPERFPDPDRFNITRKENRHLAFGYAAHFCFGAPLARLEGQIVFDALLRRFPEITLEPGPLAWRTNLGLRGLKSLPVSFGVKFRAGLKEQLGAEVEPAPSAEKEITQSPEGVRIPISFAQQQIWLHEQLNPGVPLYNEPLTVFRRGPLGVEALERALGEIVRRHEAWRTNFEVGDGEPFQVVRPATAIRFEIIDLRPLPEAERELKVHAVAMQQARKPFDLRRDRLFRVTLIRMGEAEYCLCMTLHHLIFDGLSAHRIFLNELVSLYNSFSTGRACALPELPIQYGDFAYWQRRQAPDPTHMEYWRGQLTGDLPVLQLTTDYPRPAVQTFRGAIHRFVLPKGLSEDLKQLGRAEGCTLFMMLLAGFLTLLYRYSGQDDIIVGTVTGARKRQELEAILGCFQNPLPLRAKLSGNLGFRELLDRVRETTLDALSHDDVPFQQLVRELCTNRDASRHPFFDVLFSLVPAELAESPGWSSTQFNVDTGLAKFDIYLELQDKSEGLEGRFIYNTDLFDAHRIEGIARHLQVVLEGILADPSQRLSRLPLLTEVEKQKILVEWNRTALDYPQSSVADLFEQRVRQAPDAVALVYGETQMSYRDLNQRANQLAHYLRSLGVGPDRPVGICLKRSPEMIVGLLGVLKAGGAYVPLDPGNPGERLSFMLQDTRACLLLTKQSLLGRIPKSQTSIVCVDGEREFISRCPVENPASQITPDNLAYVIYTSGSTGSPKGVEIRHRSIVRLLFGVEYVNVAPEDTFLSLAPLAFDASTFEIWGPLLHGARCVLFPDLVPSVESLGQTLRANGVTILWLTASLFNTVIDESPEILTTLRQLLIGGEALSVAHVRRACQLLPNVRITNGYGPTESTTFTCCHHISPTALSEARSIPIGRPIANTKVYVLDQDLNAVPVGVAGELHIGGVGLARGYVNRAELTGEKFIASPFEAGERLYRTGDVVRYLESGELEFLGRRDDQVKIRGYRVELGEVEAVLGRHPGIGELVVVVREEEGSGEKRLVAYVVAAKGKKAATAGELRKYGQEKLPEYMVPWGYVFLESLPLTPNGKVDRRRLPEAMGDEESGGVEQQKRASNEVEEKLVKIWEGVLGKRAIRVEENFFELGGHSLLAVRLMHRIEREMGKRLPITALLEAPTVERMAEVIGRGEAREDWSSLVAIQPEGWRPPFFCVHGIGGTVLRFYDLARHLGREQPVYGLQAQGVSGKHPCHSRVEDMAAHYLTEIRRLQPHGPYYIAGMSFGGQIAFEIARQLFICGEQTAFLALLDSYLPKLERGVFERLFQTQLRGGRFRLLRKLKSLPKGVRRRLSNLRLPRDLKNVRAAALRAERQYVAQTYPGRVTLFRARETDLAYVDEQVKGWESVSLGGVEVHEIPGDHATMMQDPQVRQLAAQIRVCLDKKQSQWSVSWA